MAWNLELEHGKAIGLSLSKPCIFGIKVTGHIYTWYDICGSGCCNEHMLIANTTKWEKN